mmetsp:Transcript_126993/g.201435  ORF Transcript_126993/g.201435 Transcript_126993/m.201435 type:complete len:510 (-) Transcript_126993:271-1800(-)
MPEVTRLPIQDAFLVEYSRPADHRGYFNELYNETTYPEYLRGSIGGDWKQVALSQTQHVNTIRGLHMSPYNKFCSVLSGAIYDVIVDTRANSPTYLKWCATFLSEANRRQVHIPAHCLHGFLCLEPSTRMLYLQGGTFSSSTERDVNPFDPLLAVHWPMLQSGETEFIISDKDKKAPFITHETRFPELSARLAMPRVLIVGASGQVGTALVEEYSSIGYAVYGTHNGNPPDAAFLLTTGFDLEATVQQHGLIDELLGMCRPHIVIICSALTHVDQLQKDPERARLVNSEAPRLLAVAANRMGAKVVAYSTEYVWDGTEGPYSEDAPVNPLNAYGKSKADMETGLLAEVPQALVLRTTVVYGPEIQGKNFIYQLCRKLSASSNMQVVTDQISTPTYNRDLALMTRLLVDQDASGIFNACGLERMGRYEFALMAADILGHDRSLIQPVRTEDHASAARRPLSAGMKIEKLLDVLGGRFKPRSVRESLQDWMRNPGKNALALETKELISSRL